jgi:hypothetical protein
MTEILQTPEGIRVPEFRLEDDGGAQRLHQAALAGNAEFAGEVASHPGDDLNGYILHISHAPF